VIACVHRRNELLEELLAVAREVIAVVIHVHIHIFGSDLVTLTAKTGPSQRCLIVVAEEVQLARAYAANERGMIVDSESS
jgi:hypothetical protein